MPIGTGIIYNVGDLILSQVSGSGTSFLETKIAAATSSLIYFDSTARINSASLNSITVGTASYVSGSRSIITNLTASNISASGTGSFGIVGIGTTSFAYSTANRGVVEIYGSTDGLLALRNSTGNLYIQKTTTDVYINNESNGFIVISNNGSERWRITSAGILQSNGAQTIQTSTGNLTLATNAANGHILLSPNGSGNVGIGTTNPTNELHIYKLTGPTLNLQAGGTGTDGFKIIKGDSGEAYVYNQGAYGLSIGTNNTQRIYITSTGNVGIGTTAPGALLEISSSTAASLLNVKGAGGNGLLFVSGSGNVGIGTTVTVAKLQVAGAGIFASELLHNSSDQIGWVNAKFTDYNDGHGIYISSLQAGGGKWLSGEGRYWNSSFWRSTSTTSTAISLDSGALKFYTNSGLTANSDFQPSERMRINSAGLVGIGTTSPGALLDVSYGDYQSAGTVRIGADLGANTSRTNVSRKWGLITGYNYTNASAAIPIIGYDSANTYTAINIGGGTSSIPASPTYISFFTTSSLSTYGAERVRIISDGNVGIGTTVPGALLHVYGATPTIRVQGSSAASAKVDLVGTYTTWSLENQYVNGANNDMFRIYNSALSADAITINRATNNVGIGTTSPGSRLEVQFPTNPATDNGAGNNVLRVWTSASFAADVGGAIGLGGTYNTSSYQSFGQIAGRKTNALSSSNSGYLQFATVNNGGTMNEQMRIDASGNLLIGKTDTLFTSAGTIIYPSSGLDVIRDGNPTLALNRLTSEGRIIDLYIATSLVGSICGLSGGGVSFNTSTTEKMRITSDGNVGIGTTSVSANLVVGYNGTVHYEEPGATNVLIKGKTSNARALLEIHDAAGVVKSYFQSVYSTGLAYIGTYSTHSLVLTTGGTEKVRLDTNGNVGIGTTSPKNKLHVAGLVTLDSTIIYSKVNNVTTNDPIRITIPFTKINTGADFIVKVKAVAMTSNGSGVNYLDYVGYSGYTFNFNVNLTTIEKLGNVVVNSYVSASSGTAGNLYVELNGDDGYLQDSNWTIQTDIMGNSMYSTFDSGSITTFVTSISEDILETSFNKYFGGNVGIGTTSPGYKLDVSGSSRHGYRAADTHQFTGSVSVSGSVTAASFTGSLSGSITSALTASYLTPANSYTITNLTASNISASLTGSFGMVGIGTSSPSYKLDIAGGIKIGGEETLPFAIGSMYLSYNSAINRIYYGDGTGYDLRFSKRGAGATTDFVTFKDTGNVGIGTTSPVARLTVTPSGSAFDSSNTMVAYFGKTTANGYGSTFIRVARSDSTTTTGSNAEYTDIEHNSGGATPFRYGTYCDTNIINGWAATNGVYGSINFVTSGSTGMTIAGGTSAGNVGIGTTNPAAMLHVQKSQNSETTVIINNTNAGTAAAARLDLQSHASNYLTLQAYGQNFSGNVCGIAGAKLNTILDNALTANSTGLLIGTTSTNPLYFATANAERMRIDSGGNVGIGTTSPTINGGGLHIYGSGQKGIRISGNSSNSYSVEIGCDTTKMSFIQTVGTADRGLQFYTGNASTVVMTLTGSNVGIGTTSPAYSLDVRSTAVETVAQFRGGNDTNIIIGGNDAGRGGEQYITYQNADTAGAAWMVGMDDGEDFRFAYGLAGEIDDAKTKVKIGQDGNVGIGTTAPAAKLEISGSSNSVLLNIKSAISGAILYVSGSGAVGIGTSNVGAYTLQVSGSFAATTKSFVIEHPTKAGKKLIYGSLESPYHGIRLTGRDTLVNGKCKIQLPDYMYKLILHDSVNIQLTGIKCNKTLYIDDINIPENYFTIAYDKTVFESYKDYEFFWDFTAIRADVPELITEV